MATFTIMLRKEIVVGQIEADTEAEARALALNDDDLQSSWDHAEPQIIDVYTE